MNKKEKLPHSLISITISSSPFFLSLFFTVKQLNRYNFTCFHLQITTSAKKLWEKSSVSDMKIPTGGSLAPLQLHGGPEQMWRDSTWSTQGETILAPPRRAYPHESNASAGILRLVLSNWNSILILMLLVYEAIRRLAWCLHSFEYVCECLTRCLIENMATRTPFA